NDAYRAEATNRLMTGLPEPEVMVAPPAAENLKAAKWRLALDLPLQAGEMESRIPQAWHSPTLGADARCCSRQTNEPILVGPSIRRHSTARRCLPVWRCAITA